jgi:hypothetical protein
VTDRELALQLDKRARQIEDEAANLFVELGLICKQVADRELWRHIEVQVRDEDGSAIPGEFEPAHSFDHWVHDALPWSNGTAYSALGVARDCADIPIEERREIPRGNLETLRKLSPAVRRDPLIREAAKKEKPEQFVRTIADNFPTQHLEISSPMRFRPSEGQRGDIEAALTLCIAQEGCNTREEALWAMAEFYKAHRLEFGVSESEEVQINQ